MLTYVNECCMACACSNAWRNEMLKNCHNCFGAVPDDEPLKLTPMGYFCPKCYGVWEITVMGKGGTISVTDADGTTFETTVPPER